MDNPSNIEQLSLRYGKEPPQEVLRSALTHYPNCAISFSGAEDVVLIDMAVRIQCDVRVFCLDTGRLHPETYRFLEQVREHYGLSLEVLSPEQADLERLTREKGLFSFYHDGHKECCAVRKVAPLRRRLATLDAWITGQRHDQSTTRTKVSLMETDPVFSTPEHALVKFNPLANWSSDQVWRYIQEYDVPVNSLHRQGYISIGCEPCSRPVLPNQHERMGRWWWEDASMKECGLHQGDQKMATTDNDGPSLRRMQVLEESQEGALTQARSSIDRQYSIDYPGK